jgi:hypothetical protein
VAKDVNIHLQIAFEGGQIVGADVTKAVADALGAALAEDREVFELESEDGTYIVALRKVAYVRRSERETTIGFGAVS